MFNRRPEMFQKRRAWKERGGEKIEEGVGGVWLSRKLKSIFKYIISFLRNIIHVPYLYIREKNNFYMQLSTIGIVSRISDLVWGLQPISCHWSLSLPPENIRKPEVMVLTVLLRKFQKSQECSSFRFSKVTCVFQLRISKKPRVCFNFEFPKATGVF